MEYTVLRLLEKKNIYIWIYIENRVKAIVACSKAVRIGGKTSFACVGNITCPHSRTAARRQGVATDRKRGSRILRTLIFKGLFWNYFCSVYVLFIYQSSHYLLHKDILNTVLQHWCLSLKIRGCCSWGNCEQDCAVIYSKHFTCFSTILVCTCVKISRWERSIIVMQRRTN
jgi:hypothetical protein